jgi:hypothetical protein
VRDPPELAATLSFTVPFPDPDAPAATVIQLSLLATVHAQPSPAVTLTVTSPPVAPTCWDCGAMAKVQPADCDTEICFPATFIVPVRAGPVTGAILNLIVPPPLPDVWPVSAIHDAPLDAVHSQPSAAPMVADPLPPPAPKDCDNGPTSKLQPFDCVSVTLCPATSTVPVRVGPLVGSTTIRAAPGPAPVVPSVTRAQSTLLAAVHGHPAPVVTAMVVVPPDAPVPYASGDAA